MRTTDRLLNVVPESVDGLLVQDQGTKLEIFQEIET